MAQQHTGSETVIAQGVKVEGDFTSNGDIRIDGELRGTLQTSAHLQVGESAVIHANVAAGDAVIGGVIVGNIIIKQGLQLLANSRVDGDITTQSLSVAEGAVINGTITMGKTSSRATAESEE